MLDNAAPSLKEDSVWTLVAVGEAKALAECHSILTIPFTVGRRPDLSLYIPSPTVSQIHAEIVEKDGQLRLRDLRSTNGTYLNGDKVEGTVDVRRGDLIQFADMPFRIDEEVSRLSKTMGDDMQDVALALAQFDRLITERAIVAYYQPIVRAQNCETIAYESLGRGKLYGLEQPAAMFRAASQFNMENELSRMLRHAAILASAETVRPPHLFLNTHPKELEDLRSLIHSLQQIRRVSPTQELTLEIHESTISHRETMSLLRLALDDLGMHLAFDDFGAGQSRLRDLTTLRPDYLKFDKTMIEKIDQASTEQQKMIASLVAMTNEMGIASLAEGIESKGETDVCRQLGFQLFQGYYFGHPAKASSYLRKRKNRY